MPRISTTLLRPGMVLDEDVVAPGGQRIAGAGVMLNDKHLAALKTWGVAAAVITEDTAPKVDPAMLAQARRVVAPRFAGQPTDHPAVRELFRMAVERHLATQPPAATP